MWPTPIVAWSTYRNKLSHIIRKSKKEYYGDLIAAAQGDSQKNWKVLNKALNRGQKKSVLPDIKDTDWWLEVKPGLWLVPSVAYSYSFIQMLNKLNKLNKLSLDFFPLTEEGWNFPLVSRMVPLGIEGSQLHAVLRKSS